MRKHIWKWPEVDIILRICQEIIIKYAAFVDKSEPYVLALASQGSCETQLSQILSYGEAHELFKSYTHDNQLNNASLSKNFI